jgi:hypothetical protein
MRAAERFAKRHLPVESQAQIASAAESSISRTRPSLSIGASFASDDTGLTSECDTLEIQRGKKEDRTLR